MREDLILSFMKAVYRKIESLARFTLREKEPTQIEVQVKK